MKKTMSCFLWIRSGRVFPAVLLVFTLAGCDGGDVKVYKLAKDSSAAKPQSDSAMPPMAGGAPAQPQLKWTLPEGWQEVAPGEMRVASFRVTGPDGKQADVSVIPLPGMAGGDLNNVNRWRGQVGLPPVKMEELAKLGEKVAVADSEAMMFDQAGSATSGDKTRILATVLHREDMAWFFKMTGDEGLVEKQKPAFVGFLKSLKFGAGQSQAALPPDHPVIGGSGLPTGHPEISAAPAAAAPSSEGKPKWQVPPDWKEISGGQFLVAKFMIGGDAGGQAAVNVSSSAGDGGGLALNVNRWRNQLGLKELSSEEIAKTAKSIEIVGGKAMIVEMSGMDVRSGQPAQTIGAMVSLGGQAWFYKLMGDGKVVEAQREQFTKFVQSAKY